MRKNLPIKYYPGQILFFPTKGLIEATSLDTSDFWIKNVNF